MAGRYHASGKPNLHTSSILEIREVRVTRRPRVSWSPTASVKESYRLENTRKTRERNPRVKGTGTYVAPVREMSARDREHLKRHEERMRAGIIGNTD